MKNIKSICILAVGVMLLSASCGEGRTEHYDNGGVSASAGGTLWDYICANAEFSGFRERAADTHLEEMLKRSTSYTVFIPSNEVFESASYTDEEWIRILEYQISNSFYTADRLRQISRLQTMLSAGEEYDGKKLSRPDYKFVSVADAGGEISVSGQKLDRSIILDNGVIYPIGGAMVPASSIWEYVTENKETYSRFYDLFKAAEYLELDLENSIKVGFDELGRDIYDEQYTLQNPLFDQYGRLSSEKELFTVGLFSDAAFDAATSTLPSFEDLPDEVKDRIVTNEVKRYIFAGDHPQLPFMAYNTSDAAVDMSVDDFAPASQMSNGTIHHFREDGLRIDFTKYFSPIHIELEDLTTFGTTIATDGLIGGAVDPPTNIILTLSNGETVSAKRFSHKVGNTANRIPFGVYVNKDDLLPISYTIRWKIIKIGEQLDKYNWFQLKEFAAGATGATSQYNLVTSSDSRQIAQNLVVRLVDADGNTLHSQSDIITNSTELKEATSGQAKPIPFKTIRADNTELYNRIKACEEIFVEYDWEFDDNRFVSNKAYIGIAVELTTRSTADDVISIDIDYLEIIPNL